MIRMALFWHLKNAGRFKEEYKASGQGLEMARNLKRNSVSEGTSGENIEK